MSRDRVDIRNGMSPGIGSYTAIVERDDDRINGQR